MLKKLTILFVLFAFLLTSINIMSAETGCSKAVYCDGDSEPSVSCSGITCNSGCEGLLAWARCDGVDEETVTCNSSCSGSF